LLNFRKIQNIFKNLAGYAEVLIIGFVSDSYLPISNHKALENIKFFNLEKQGFTI